MTNENGVAISRASIEQARKASGEDFWLHFVTDEVDNLEAVKAALVAADGGAPENENGFGSMDMTPAPHGFAVMVGPGLWDDAVFSWVDRFASALERAGMSGRLEGIMPEWGSPVLAAGLEPTPTLFVQFGAPLPNLMSNAEIRWEVPPSQTRAALAELLGWALTASGAILAMQEFLEMPVEDDFGLQAHLVRVLGSTGVAGVSVVDPTGTRARHVVITPRAHALVQLVGPDWRETVQELTGLARILPPPLDLAFVRIAQRGIGGVHLDSAQPLDRVRESAVRSNEHLLNRYIPDAHGVQIVNDTHLAAASDLSRWEITDLGQGRHLVVASDLEAWYGHGLPDPDVLARARVDWGEAILTEEIIAADWRSRQPGAS